MRPGPTPDERQKLKDLEKEVKELQRANEMAASTGGRNDFLRDRARRSTEEVVRYIDSRKDRWGVEPICTTLQFASRTYYAAKRRPSCARKIRDEVLKPEIARVHQENLDVYGADKVWTQMKREGYPGRPLHGRAPDEGPVPEWCPARQSLQARTGESFPLLMASANSDRTWSIASANPTPTSG